MYTELLGQMTLQEKIGQMTQVMLNDENADEICQKIKDGAVGACLVADSSEAGNVDSDFDARTVESAVRAAKESRLGIPLLLGRDIIHGSKTIFPIPLSQAASFDPELAFDGANRMAREAAKEGINWTYSPMLDVARDPRWGRIIEGFGESPFLTTEFARAFVRGIQGAGVAACAKHFIGYAAGEGGRDYTHSEITDYTLRNTYLPPFIAAVEEGCATVMNSFSEFGGVPCVANPYLFREILKKELRFDGFVISDWGSILWQLKHKNAKDTAQCAENALNAGIDMEMATQCYSENLEQLVQNGVIDEKQIDDAVYRILLVKERFAGNLTEKGNVLLRKDYDYALKAALHSAVLLKNKENTLPLDNEKILISGPFMDERRSLCGSWCGSGAFSTAPTFCESMEKVFGKDRLIKDDNPYALNKRYHNSCDVVVLCLGEDAALTGERSCMASVEIEAQQAELVKRAHQFGKKVIVVIFAGRPLVLTALEEYADAVLYAWQGGLMCAEAAAQILKGNFNPCGKTPVTFLRSTCQVPMYHDCYRLPTCDADENMYYGKTAFPQYLDCEDTPLYPFGYGLSYSSFVYSAPVADEYSRTLAQIEAKEKFRIRTEITNSSDRDGWETCQMYVQAQVSRKLRPIKELRGFRKVFVPAGKTVEIEFSVGLKELGYYPEKELCAECGTYTIFVGASSYAKSCVQIEITENKN